MDSGRIAELRAAYRASLTGDTGRALAALAEADASKPAGAWLLAMRGVIALLEGTHAPATAEELEAALQAGTDARDVVLDACFHAETHAFITFDRHTLARLHALRASAGSSAAHGELERHRVLLMLEILSAGGAALRGETLRAIDLAERGGNDGLLVELLALQALVESGANEMTLAVEHARKAARLARAHEQRIGRFLASLILARVRRLSGRPHLAARILSTLMPFLPAPWRGWLHWELELAGEPLRDDALSTMRSDELVSCLRKVLDACLRESPADFRTSADDLRSRVATLHALRPETETVLALLDWTISENSLPPDCAAFVQGEQSEIPLGLHGLVLDPGSSSAAPVAFAAWFPERSPRRVLGIAAGVVSRATGARVLELSRLHSGRADVALATLALAGPTGVTEAELFRACYGFRYAPNVHEAALGMLIHRARARLPDQASVRREQGRVSLVGSRPLLAPDPRCAEHVEGRLLRLVAREGWVTTRSAARSLGVSLRTVQAAMSSLVDRGECMLDRSGRRIQYRIDDTSYAIPPAARVS